MGIQIIPSANWSGNIYVDSVDLLSGTPTPGPTSTSTPTPAFSATFTPTVSPTPSPTSLYTYTFTPTPSPTPTSTPVPNADVPYPNPDNGIAPVVFFHNLTQPADRVILKIYSLAYRKIYEDDTLPTTLGQNQYSLDWKKSGLNLSNGLYYFVLIEKRQSKESKTIMKVLLFR
jgi:hypothetical protein